MGKTLMQIMQPEIDEKVNTAIDNATRTNLFLYVQDGAMNLDYAAKQAKLSTADFSAAMTNAGYKLPQMANR